MCFLCSFFLQLKFISTFGLGHLDVKLVSVTFQGRTGDFVKAHFIYYPYSHPPVVSGPLPTKFYYLLSSWSYWQKREGIVWRMAMGTPGLLLVQTLYFKGQIAITSFCKMYIWCSDLHEYALSWLLKCWLRLKSIQVAYKNDIIRKLMRRL